ncbi:MAG TPA: GNAT family N-acetyltransferase [Jatrophihabitans sp.]|nr:GNAT family N-acetyltransferase [Jatrophihabitans sp.]
MPELITERLRLRRWSDDDVKAMTAINSDPEVMRWISDGSLSDSRRTAASIARYERSWDQNGFGLFAVELRASGQLAGFTGLAIPEFLPQILPAVEIGWRLGRQFWGAGLATEAARAVLAFGFEQRDLDRVVSIYQPDNTASGRIMRKLGMRLIDETVDPTCQRQVQVLAITAEDFRTGSTGNS